MNILVCIKQRIDTREMNRFDAHALEQALCLAEQLCLPDRSRTTSIDVITAGPKADSEVIQRAFGMGADTGYHVVTEDQGFVPSFVTASRLAAVAKTRPYDLILTGMMSEDYMAGQTGPMLARMLGYPCATGVIKLDLSDGNTMVSVDREMENGFSDRLLIRLPAVLTLQAGINTPRYPSLSNMLSADKKKIIQLSDSDLFSAPVQPKESIVGMEYPEKTRSGRVLEGSLSDKADQLLAFLQEKNFL